MSDIRPHVIFHRRSGRLRVHRPDGVEDAAVVFVSQLAAVAAESAAAAGDEQFLNGCQHDGKERIAGCVGEGGVELQVGLGVGFQGTARIAEELLGFLQAREVLVGAVLGGEFGDGGFQRQTHAGQVLQAQVHRPLDVLSRYGGEEFAALLYDIDAPQARDLAERMRIAVSAISIEHRGSRVARVVTVSIGIAAIQPLADRGPLGALQLADEALYTAKVRGRNKVHLAAESDYSDLQTGVFEQQSFAGT